MSANSSRAHNQIATKPSQHFGTPTIEYRRGGDVRLYTSAKECAAKTQKTTVLHFGFTKKVYGLPCMVLLFSTTPQQHNTVHNSIDNSIMKMSLTVRIAVEACRRQAASAIGKYSCTHITHSCMYVHIRTSAQMHSHTTHTRTHTYTHIKTHKHTPNNTPDQAVDCLQWLSGPQGPTELHGLACS